MIIDEFITNAFTTDRATVAHYLCGFLEGLKPQKKQVPEPGSINILRHGSNVKSAVKTIN